MPAMAAFSKAALDGGIEHGSVQGLYQVALHPSVSHILFTLRSHALNLPTCQLHSVQASAPFLYKHSHLIPGGFMTLAEQAIPTVISTSSAPQSNPLFQTFLTFVPEHVIMILLACTTGHGIMCMATDYLCVQTALMGSYLQATCLIWYMM